MELRFLTYPVEVVEDPQTLDGVQFLAVGAIKMSDRLVRELMGLG